MRRKVLFLTGIRSEYDILAPVLAAVDRTPGLDTGVIVTGAHLSPEYGYSVEQIEDDGFRIAARIESLLKSNSLVGRAKGAALQISGLADTLDYERPDFLVVTGDREESITGAMTAAYLRIPVVHIGGGDHATDGNVDNIIRHAVTKLSHLHMAASSQSANRIRALGEEDWRVHTVGAPGLDRIKQTPKLTRQELMQKLDVDWSDDYVVVLYHPTIRDYEDARTHMETILSTVAERIRLPMAIIFPNSDPGSRDVIQGITDFVGRSPQSKAFAYLPRVVFVNLLRHARALIGNSSAGLLEGPMLKLPVVNVGLRQTGREHGDNVIFVDHDQNAIAEAVHRAVSDPAFRRRVANGSNPYGDGEAGLRIARVLSDIDLGDRLMLKPFLEQSPR